MYQKAPSLPPGATTNIPPPSSNLLNQIRKCRVTKHTPPAMERQGTSHWNKEGELIVWTDGSVVNKKAGFAVFFGSKNLHNTAKRAVGQQTANKAEQQVVLEALALTKQDNKVLIVTDNKGVCNLVNSMISSPNSIHRKIRRSVERRILELITERGKAGISTRCQHVYSHVESKLKGPDARKWQGKTKQCREEWGALFPKIISGNEMADQLAKEGAQKADPQPYSRVLDFHTNIGVFHKGRWIDGKVGKFIYRKKAKRSHKTTTLEINQLCPDGDQITWKVATRFLTHPHHTQDKAVKTNLLI